MKRSRFIEQQIAFALQQAKQGTQVAEATCKMDISEQTFYRWKKKFGGLMSPRVRKLRQLEEENARLRQLLADLSGQGDSPGGNPKKALKPAQRRETLEFLHLCYQVGVRQASQKLPGPRSILYYRSRKAKQAPLRHRIKEIAAIRVRYGYRRIHTLLQ